MKKYVENRKIGRKTMKNANKVKNELKLNVDEQQDNIKHLKEYCEIDDKKPPWKDKAVFVAWNQPFEWKKIVGKTYSGKVIYAVVK